LPEIIMHATASRWLIALAPILFCAPAHATSAIFTVTSTSSNGACTADSTSDANCTLDAAITTAASGDVIEFAPAVQGGTINAPFGLPNLTKDVTIDASPNGITLDANGASAMLYVDSGATVVLRRLTLQHLVSSNGSALYNNNGNLTIDSCTFTNNTSTAGAGAAVINGSTLLVLNSTFVGNHAVSGGAMYLGGNAVIAYSTFIGNTATAASGAIFVPGTLTILSSMLAGNTAPSAPNISGFTDSITSLGHNLIDNDANSSWVAQTGDQINVAAQYDPALLANNGGPTQTVALMPASPARSGGDCAGHASGPALPPVLTDQRGYVRSVPCTIGAFDMTSIFYGTFEAQ